MRAAPSLSLLVIFRALQAVGGAPMMAISPAMLAPPFRSRSGAGPGVLALVVSGGTSAGPALVGFITQAFSWRWILYINVPLGMIGIGAALRLLKEPMHLSLGQERFDPIGAIVLSASVSCLMLALRFGQELGWRSFNIVGLLLMALMLLAAFIVHEWRWDASDRRFLPLSQPAVHRGDCQQLSHLPVHLSRGS